MDVFERIKQILSPSNIKPEVPASTGAQRGLETINQIRSSLNLPSAQPTPISTPRFEPTFAKPTFISPKFEPSIPTGRIATPQPTIKPVQVPQAFPEMTGIGQPVIKPFKETLTETIKPVVIKPTGLKTTPTFEEPIAKFGLEKIAKPAGRFQEGFEKLINIGKKGEGLSGWERALAGVEGIGNLQSIPNEIIVQPIYGAIKLGIRGLSTGKITQEDVNDFIYASGPERGTIFKAFNTNEQEFGNKFGQPALLTARFLDFAPELIDIPSAKSGETVALARKVKLPIKGAEEVASKGKKVDDAIKAFETKTGQALDNATKAEIKKTVNNPTPFLERLKGGLFVSRRAEQAQGVGLTNEVLIQEAKKYKTADEFVMAQEKNILYHGTGEVVDKLKPISDDVGILWTAPKRNIAESYIPDARDKIFVNLQELKSKGNQPFIFDGRGNPSWVFGEKGKKIGIEIDKVKTNSGDLLVTKQSADEILKLLESKGIYDEKTSSFIIGPANKVPAGKLYQLKLKQGEELKIKDLRRDYGLFGEEIADTDRLEDFLKAKKDGYDGVKILDFNHTDQGDTLLHESIGLFKSGINKLDQTDQILTKEQLTDIWKKSQTTGAPIVQKATPEVAKGLTTTVENIKASIKKGIPPANVSNLTSLGQKVVSNAQKERRFAKTTVAGAERTAPEVKKILDEANDLFSPLNNKSAFADAERFVNSNSTQDVLNKIRSTRDARDVSYLGQALMNKMQKIGDYNSEAQVALEISQRATEFGQAIQALSIWKKLSPTGAKLWAQKEITKANDALGLKEGAKGFIKLSEKKLEEIGNQARKIAETTDAYKKEVETALLYKMIFSDVPKDLLTKIGTYQTIAQLLNTKTLNRNVAGNMIFGVLEAVSNGIASPLDYAISMYTKKRGVANLSPIAYGKGFKEGFVKGVKESLLGIDTLNSSSLSSSVQNGFVFQSKVMQGFEKALSLILKPFDRAFYQANYRATLEGLMKANNVTKPTQEMLDQAHYMGLYRTFQDENAATAAFSGLKKFFNVGYDRDAKKVVFRPFGLGDFIIKYTKVPANIIMRAADYSPLGYVKAVIELAQPLFKREFNQAEFVNAIARATTGTFGLMNTGYALGKLGIITPKPDSNKDVRNAQQLDGVRSYAFNVSALKRYVASGFDPEAAKRMEGDELFSYDWAQPASIPLAMGANWAESETIKKNSSQQRLFDALGAGGQALADGYQTLAEQPVLQGLQTLFKSGQAVQGLIQTLQGVPASFVPTVLNQINQFTDNTRRETYDPNLFEQGKNLAINKIPFLSQSLPPKYDIFGKPAEKYQGGTNTFVNVFLNPAFVSKVGSDDSLKEVIRLYESVDDTGVIPNTVTSKVKVNGEDRLLSGQEMSNYQKEIGTKSDEYIRKVLSNEDYYKLPDDAKASLIAKGLSNINSAAKINLFGDRPKDISFDVSLLKNNQMDNYVYKNVTDAILDQPKKELNVKLDQLEILMKGQRNPQEISKFIVDNKIPQTSISGVITKIKKDEAFKQLPEELKKYSGLTNSQLEELKKLKPQLTTEITQYQAINKAYDSSTGARLSAFKSLGTKKPTGLKVKAPKKPRSPISGLKPRKPAGISLRPKKPKLSVKFPKPKKIRVKTKKKTTKLV